MSRTRGGSAGMPIDEREAALSLVLRVLNQVCRRLDALEAGLLAARRASAESVTLQTQGPRPTVH